MGKKCSATGKLILILVFQIWKARGLRCSENRTDPKIDLDPRFKARGPGVGKVEKAIPKQQILES